MFAKCTINVRRPIERQQAKPAKFIQIAERHRFKCLEQFSVSTLIIVIYLFDLVAHVCIKQKNAPQNNNACYFTQFTRSLHFSIECKSQQYDVVYRWRNFHFILIPKKRHFLSTTVRLD